MTFPALLEELLARQNLTAEKITHLISETMHGRLTAAQIAAWLMALRAKGETPEEIAACARLMREIATPINRSELPPLFIDTCGTGGDRSHLINISTLVGLTLAALSIPVAKHGNRAVSSSSGSADVLEALGYPIEENPQHITARLAKNNFAFFFAPLYHPAMKHAGPIRKELGVRTIFNVLGPLSNPAGAPVQFMGVYSAALIQPMAETLKLIGLKAACVVHSEEGLDEISPLKPTQFAWLQDGTIRESVFTPPPQNYLRDLDELRADTKERSLAIFREVIAGKHAAGAYMTAINAAFAQKLFDAAQSGKTPTEFAPSGEEINAVFELIQSGALGAKVRFS